MATEQTTQLITELQRIKPRPTHLVVTVDGEETPRKLTIQNVRKAWSRLEAVLDGLKWLRAEVWHKDETVGVFEAGDDGDDVDEDSPGLTLRERELVAVLRDQYRDVTKAWQQVTAALTSSLQTMSHASAHQARVYQNALEAQRQLQLSSGGGDGDDDPLLALAGAIAGAQRPAPKNDTKGKGADRQRPKNAPPSTGDKKTQRVPGNRR